ncbi:histidine kinase [Glaciihabitans arcticus]|uniref:Histidine kinase n=1 Tax=Glaciihabitans arcticus TaxID=2668039 RepID=A0A4Q9GQS0_9MICO|nr:ATP-binding protein [Glaciihabitans arcticus]TBN55928.1 histidine kinase [Glaciihabitans arcticus]
MATRAPALRGLPSGKPQRTPISRTQVEAVISRSVAAFGVVFVLQTFPQFVEQSHNAHPVWLVAIASAVFGSIFVALSLSMLGRGVRIAHASVAIIYLVGLCTWPLAVTDPTPDPLGRHWLYYLLTVATATAAIGLPARLATVYLFVVPTLYGVFRMSAAGGYGSWEQSVLDAIYAMILGGAIIVIITMLRAAAAAVDSAQAAALDRYSHAVRQHATEVERVQVDSIVHDSVLTTLLSAARAFTPESKALAARMAGNAIGHLREAALVSPDDGSTVRISAVSTRITEVAATMAAPFEVRTRSLAAWTMPVLAAEALYAASVQAMLNSIQHAGGAPSVRRWVTIRGGTPHGIEIEVGDTGAGFSLIDVPTERLGVRVSILERVANAGGVAEIDSVANEGTVVTIRWPRNDPAPPLIEDEP